MQLQPHTLSLRFYRSRCKNVHLLPHHAVTQLSASCASPWWLPCCELAHSSHIQWNTMVSVKLILLPLTRWSVLLANLTVSTIINYCFHYAVTLSVSHFPLQRPLKSALYKMIRTKPGKLKVIPLFNPVSYQKYCTLITGTQQKS